MKRTNLLNLLTDYEQGKLVTEGVHAGTDEPVTKDDSTKSKLLILELKRVIKNNADWLKYLYAILTAIIVLLSIFLWRKQDDMTFFFAILGGQGLSILFCINRLSHFYKQKRASEILLVLYQAAITPNEKAKILREVIEFLKKDS